MEFLPIDNKQGGISAKRCYAGNKQQKKMQRKTSMRDFIFQNPTKIIFGENASAKLGDVASNYGDKALLVYGQKSIKKNGLYDKIINQLKTKKIEFVEHGGVKANPSLKHGREGVKKALDNKIDFVIAVGGGSVIDEAKAIAAAVASKQDIWDFFTGKAMVTRVLPLVTVLTLPATASEMNGNMVMTNEETKEKLGMGNIRLHPAVSILDPLLTYSIPLQYTAYAAVDMVSHLTESYFNNDGGWTVLQKYYVEGMVKTVMEALSRVLNKADDAEGRATLMWAATMAWNGINLAGVGTATTPCHKLEHPISAVYDIAHGAGLSIITPAWLTLQLENKTAKIARFAREVFKIEKDDDMAAAAAGVEALKKWYRQIGAPISFKEAGIKNPNVVQLTDLVLKSVTDNKIPHLNAEFITKVYELSC